MTSANIQHKNTFLNWGISIAIEIGLSAGLSATATSSYDISTIAGNGAASFSGDGNAATAATLNGPRGVFLDSASNVYIADYNNNKIRKITASTGVISSIAGGSVITEGFAGDGGPATAAAVRLNIPSDAFVDNLNNIYIADSNNNRIRMVVGTAGTYFGSSRTANFIYTIAGAGTTAGFAGDGGSAAATAVRLNNPLGVCVDSSSNIYIADTMNNRIRMVTAAGIISTIAGTGAASFSGDGAVATAATLRGPQAIFVDSAGSIYIADTANHSIRKITASTGFISTIAGTGTTGFTGDNGLATSASLAEPRGISVDSAGNIYISDSDNHRIRKVTVGDTCSTIAGGNATTAGFAGDSGSAIAAAVRFNNPNSICVDNLGNLYIADTTNHRIRMVVGTAGTYFGVNRNAADIGKIYTVAGGSVTTSGFAGDGASATASNARLNSPRGIFVDSLNNLYIADSNNNRIRMVVGTAGTYFGSSRTANFIYTIAGAGTTSGFAGDGGSATATAVRLNNPLGVCVDSSSNIYIADTMNNRIRMVVGTAGTYFGSSRTANFIYTIAGAGTTSGFAGDGGSATATAVRFNNPNSVCVDSAGNLYIADTGNQRIRKVAAGPNTITTIAGSGTAGFSDGIATTAMLNNPSGVSLDSLNNVYIADSGNQRIRKLIGNILSTFSGTGTASFSGDNGRSILAAFSNPRDLCVDSAGNVYVADSGNNRIRKLFNTITTIAGTGAASFGGDGGPATAATLNAPRKIFIDSSGNIFIADSGNNVIRKLLSKLTVSGGGTLSATATGTAYIQGGGTAVLPASNSISAVEVNNGTLQVSSSAPITFNASGGSAIVEILAAINTGAFTFNTPGAVKIATGIAAILDAPSGSGTMSKTGAGRLRAIANLSSSSTPVAVSEGILEVSGTGKLPNAATSVASGATLQLGTSGGTVASGAVANASVASGGIMSILAGATGAVTSATIASGGVLSVAAGVTAPSGMFTTATFRSGGILQVGDGATLGQSFNSVA